MRFLYLTEQGSVLRKTSKRLLVSKEDKTLAEIPGIGLDGVLIFGNVQITSQAVGFLLENGIQVGFLSSEGKYRGSLAPAASKNVLLRVAQYERYLDEEFQRGQASILVSGKIQNQKALIKRYVKNYPEYECAEELAGLDAATAKAREKPPVPVLLGIEGQATATYFRAYGKFFRHELKFDGRNRRPPKDPVNALLSFGYTLVTNEIFSLLLAIGFDPYIGSLHGIDYGRPSLALDMVEEFRHPIVDRFTLYLVNNQILTLESFEEKEGTFRLKPEALKRYFAEYHKRVNAGRDEESAGGKNSYRILFREQAYKMVKSIQSGVPYEPYRME